MFVLTAEEMRDLDRETIHEVGIPGPVLMENAGRGAVCALWQAVPDLAGRRVAVLAGRGNNGGDGFVIARCLTQQGVKADVYLVGRKEQVSGDARVPLEILQRLDIAVQEVSEGEGLMMPGEIPWESYQLFVDALLGTGLSSEVRGIFREVIEAMNRSPAPVMAVDIPSGLSSDHGRPLGQAVKARFTVTFGAPKVGQFLYPGRSLCGDLWVVDIGIPSQVVEKRAFSTRLVTPRSLRRSISPRSKEDHKGQFGHLLIVAGSPGKTGAGVMASEAALRVGAGLVTLAIPRSLDLAMEARLTEVMTLPVSETPAQTFSMKALDEILSALEGKNCMAVGPGVSTLGDTPKLMRELVGRVEQTMVIDADALNALVGHLEILAEAPGPRILTPHPGEMGRLLELPAAEIQADRIGSARILARRTKSYVVLKGAGTVLAHPGGLVGLVPTGNPVMASAGFGDVLTGMVAGLTAQGMAPFEAMCLGSYLHGWVADEWAAKSGGRGMIATDLLARIPAGLEKIVEGDSPRTWPKEVGGCPFHV